MINIIVAYCKNRGIGLKNQLPWYLPKDLKRFKYLTHGDENSVIMGRKTWESLPFKPLLGRKNIIVSTTMNDRPLINNRTIKRNLTDAINYSKEKKIKQTWIIGGSCIYKEAIESNLVNNIYATEIDANLLCDVFFPELPNQYKEVHRSSWYTHNFLDYRYIKYKNDNIS